LIEIKSQVRVTSVLLRIQMNRTVGRGRRKRAPVLGTTLPGDAHVDLVGSQEGRVAESMGTAKPRGGAILAIGPVVLRKRLSRRQRATHIFSENRKK